MNTIETAKSQGVDSVLTSIGFRRTGDGGFPETAYTDVYEREMGSRSVKAEVRYRYIDFTVPITIEVPYWQPNPVAIQFKRTFSICDLGSLGDRIHSQLIHLVCRF